MARIVSEHDATRTAVTTVADVLAADDWARRRARELNSQGGDDWMDLIGWVIFIVALLFSVMVHEAGHFATAKRFGMKVTRFFVGFGPTIWSTWRGETEYGIKALPFGGFVKIIGMHSLDDVDDPADEPRSFRRQPAWQRIIVLCAGSFMHFVLAFLLIFGLALGIGIENDNTTQLGTVSSCVAANVTQLDNGICTASDKPSPAKLAGLQPGDKVIAFDGKPVSNWTQLGNAIRAARPGSPVSITVVRDGKTLTLHTTLATVSGRSGGYLGIAPTVVFHRLARSEPSSTRGRRSTRSSSARPRRSRRCPQRCPSCSAKTGPTLPAAR